VELIGYSAAMLDGLFITPAVTLIDEALAAAKASGAIAVVGSARLAKALADKREVIAVDLPPRAAKKHAGKVATLDELVPGSVVAVVGVLATDAKVTAWMRLVPDGGAIVTVDRNDAVEASRRVLCAGLRALEQRKSGRLVVTSGRATDY